MLNSGIFLFCLLGGIHGLNPRNIKDVTSPVCIQLDIPDCRGFDTKQTCSNGVWTAQYIISDAESEISEIYSQPAGEDVELIIDFEQTGKQSSANVVVTASCCVTQMEIIGIDAEGNTGSCTTRISEYQSLPEPYQEILTFEAIDAGPTWIYLEWTVDVVDPDLLKYRLTNDAFGGSINDEVCSDLTCYYNSTPLPPCTEVFFTLTPYYFIGGSTTLGDTVNTTGTTTDIVPNPPTNGNVMLSGNIATISWDEPSDLTCIMEYEACYTSLDDTTCQLTNTTSMVIDTYFSCQEYSVEIKSVTESGLKSSPLSFTTNPVDGIPGAPTNLYMVDITPFAAHLSWDSPIENSACADNFNVNWFIINSLTMQSISNDVDGVETTAEALGEYEATVAPLKPCEQYIFIVWGVSIGMLEGPSSQITDTAGEIEPAAPGNLTITPVGSGSFDVTWTAGGDTCVDHYQVCYINSITFEKVCVDDSDTSITIDNLEPCTLYEVSVTVVTPLNNVSVTIRGYEHTNDEAPGSPTNLVIVNATAHTMTIDYDSPSLNPQCVSEYLISFNDTSGFFSGNHSSTSPFTIVPLSDFTTTKEGLDACTHYLIGVIAVSRQGLESSAIRATDSTLEDIPSEVVNLSSVPTTTTILLHWNRPQVNGRCVDSYNIVSVSDIGEQVDTSVSVSALEFDTEVTLIDLTPCTLYDIAVLAKTAEGTTGIVAEIQEVTLC